MSSTLISRLMLNLRDASHRTVPYVDVLQSDVSEGFSLETVQFQVQDV